jgi:hypothetical protein
VSPDQFRELCRSTARVLQLDRPDALFDDDDVYLDGVKVGLLHAEDWDQDGVFCYADLGSIDSCAAAPQLAEEVLALNLELDSALGEVIGIERQSRHLVFRARLDNGSKPLREAEVAEQLRSYAALANELYRTVLVDLSRPAQRTA